MKTTQWIECLNEIKKARWTDGDGSTCILTLELPRRTSRKFRRALSSRRWEKKFIKHLRRAGVSIRNVRRRKP